MYCSLDRCDIELEPRNGRSRVVQTDHRTAAEIVERAPLSQIMVLIRCLNPRRQDPQLDLFYNFEHEPPELLRRALRVGAAHLWVGTSASFLHTDAVHLEPDADEVNAFANAAFDELTEGLVAETPGLDAFACLQSLEARLADTAFPEESDEASFWSTVLELGALSAASIRTTNGGSWTFNPASTGTLPLSYVCSYNGESATVNPLGKALKFIRAQGGGEEPSALVRVLAASP